MAAVGDPISMLLYPGAWFPMTGLYTDRFTAAIDVRVPAVHRGGSGTTTKKTMPDGRTDFSFTWSKPGFPGTIVAGKFMAAVGGLGVQQHPRVRDRQAQGERGGVCSAGGARVEYLTSVFGQPESGRINIVELPEDAVGGGAAWAPEMVAIAGNRFNMATNPQRLLANMLAHHGGGRRFRRRR